jgi:hypothetical protein
MLDLSEINLDEEEDAGRYVILQLVLNRCRKLLGEEVSSSKVVGIEVQIICGMS